MQNSSQNTNDLKKASLTKSILIKMIVRLTLVVFISALLSYLYIFNIREDQFLSSIQKHNQLTAEREELLFDSAQAELETLKLHLIESLQGYNNQPVDQKFNLLFEKNKDGAMRSKESLNQTRNAGFFLAKNINLNLKEKYHTLVAHELISSYGQAWSNKYFSTWLVFSSGSTLTFSKNRPRFVYSIDKNFDDRKQDYYLISTIEQNKKRQGKWTKTYFDPNFKEWMVSYVLPLDFDGKHMGAIGVDITLNELFKRVFNFNLEGSSNYLLSEDRYLIAHPKLMEIIKNSDGQIDALKVNDPKYSEIFKCSVEQKNYQKPIRCANNNFISHTLLKGPNWILATAIPTGIMQRSIIDSVKVLFLIGFIALIIEFLVLFRTINTSLTRPFQRLVVLTKKISKGDYEGSVEEFKERSDELGDLMKSFDLMKQAIQERDIKLKQKIEHSETEKESAMQIADAAIAKSIDNAKMAALGQMASGISHEINNPLFVIINCVNQINKLMNAPQLDREKIILNTTRIENMSVRISKIIKGLKSFSRNSTQDPFELVDLKTIIENTLEFCHARFDSHGVRLTIDPIVAIKLKCRETQIVQVLLNLLNNAFDSVSEQADKWIEIKFETSNGFFKFTIKDSGAGVPPDIADRIMEPFFTTKSVDRGTGLGLSIAKGIIEEHGGRLLLVQTSNPTTFSFTVPLGN